MVETFSPSLRRRLVGLHCCVHRFHSSESALNQSSSDDHGLPELTLRGILLGGLITFAFTAANVYMGLKIGLTFATSIPAAVISMAVLRLFKSSSIFENNI